MENTTKTINHIIKTYTQNKKLIAYGHEKREYLIGANDELNYIYWLLCGRDLDIDTKKYL